MTDLHSLLSTVLSDLVKKYNKFQLSNHTLDSITEGNAIIKNGSSIVSLLKSYSNTMEKILVDCKEFIYEIEEDLSQKPREEDYVYHTANGMLSYPGRDVFNKKNINVNPIIPVKDNSFLIKEINYTIRLPQVNNLKQIPPMFYVMKSDIYCCILPNVYVQVPFSELIDSTKEHSR